MGKGRGRGLPLEVDQWEATIPIIFKSWALESKRGLVERKTSNPEIDPVDTREGCHMPLPKPYSVGLGRSRQGSLHTDSSSCIRLSATAFVPACKPVCILRWGATRKEGKGEAGLEPLAWSALAGEGFWVQVSVHK